MPIYEFHCTDCKKDFEVLCSFKTDLSTLSCELCHGSHVSKKVSKFSQGGSGKSFDLGSGGHDHAQNQGGSSCGSCSTHNCGSCGH